MEKLFRFAERHTTLILLLVFLLINIFSALTSLSQTKTVEFNQNDIEIWINKYKNSKNLGDQIVDERESGLNLGVMWLNYTTRRDSIGERVMGGEKIDRTADSVFGYVWSQIPEEATVYPTEMYFYYRIPQLKVAGNLRFSDIENDNLSFAFYSTDDIHGFDSSSDYKVFSAKDGLLTENLGDNKFKLTYAGKSIVFTLPSIYLDRPQDLRLISDEEIVTKIRDESGVLFYLIFNSKTNSFYYVLDEEGEVLDDLASVAKNIFTGDRTDFAFYYDTLWNRKILIGVNTDNILQNNYYDGPFDQVPPNLELREKLYKAYPYTQYLNGLDPNGNFLDWNGSRVAISPYVDYPALDTANLVQRLEDCEGDNMPGDDLSDRSKFWACLTYESKKDFHKTIPEFFHPDGTKK